MVRLEADERLRLRSWALSLVKLLTAGTPSLRLPDLGLVFAGVYGGMVTELEPTGTPLVYVAATAPGVSQLNPDNWRDLVGPGTYAFMVVNNTDNLDLEVEVAGSFKL